MAKPLLQVQGLTLQYKTREHLVTATYRVGFEVHVGDREVSDELNRLLFEALLDGCSPDETRARLVRVYDAAEVEAAAEGLARHAARMHETLLRPLFK